MNNRYKLLFYLKVFKQKSAKAPVYVRITVNGKRIERFANLEVETSKWNQKLQCLKGNSELARTSNEILEEIRLKIRDAYKRLMGLDFTAKELMSSAFPSTDTEKTLLKLFDDHIKCMKAKKKSPYAKGTIKRHEITKKKVEDFLTKHYKEKDMYITRINRTFFPSFQQFLNTQHNLCNNTANRYLKILKTTINHGINFGWLETNPFAGYKLQYDEVEKEALTFEQVHHISLQDFKSERNNLVRDIFVLSCLLGVAYIDGQKLKYEDLFRNDDGFVWYSKGREKTKSNQAMRILTLANNLIEKFKKHPSCEMHNKVIPKISNQEYNRTLKVIASLAGINFKLTTHTTRYTFASIASANGVSVEVIQKCLGHRDIRTTMGYLSVPVVRLSTEMGVMDEKLNQKTEELNN